MQNKASQEQLLKAGLELMRQNGFNCRDQRKGRAMIYVLEDGQRVRIRTSNDPILVVVADGPQLDAELNIEGTELLLFVMLQTPRVSGPVDAYLVPTSVAIPAVRNAYRAWLESRSSKSIRNTTWNLEFGESRSSVPEECKGFARKWAQYKLNGTASTLEETGLTKQVKALSLPEVVLEARRSIALAASVPIEAVTININFTWR